MVNVQEGQMRTEIEAAKKELRTGYKKIIADLKAEYEIKLKNMENIINEKPAALDQLRTNMAQQQQTYAQATNNHNNWSTAISKTKAPISQLVVVNAAINEQKNRDKRKNNLVIFGIPESQKATIEEKMKEDGERIVKLFKDIDSETMPVFQRLLYSKGG